MTVTNFSKAKKIPDVATKKSSPTTTNFAKGMATYKANDLMGFDEAYMAQNARFDRIGEYKTRCGLHSICLPVGYYREQSSNPLVTTKRYIDMADSTIPIDLSGYNDGTNIKGLYQIGLYMQAPSGYAVAEASLWDGNTLIAKTCALPVIGVPAPKYSFIFKDLPSGGNYQLKIKPQNGGEGSFLVLKREGSDAANMDIYSATKGVVTNVFEANINGTQHVLFSFKTDSYAPAGGASVPAAMTIYKVSPGEPNPTLIRTIANTGGLDLPKNVRFCQVIDEIRYADGVEGPHKIDTSLWTDTAIQTIDLTTDVDLAIKTSNILAGNQDNIIYFDADTDTQAVWTYPYGYAYAPAANFLSSDTINAYVPGETTTTTISTSVLEPVSDTKLVADIAEGDIVEDDMGNYAEVTGIVGQNITVTAISHIAEVINSYDKFDRDYRQNFPAIKTGDPLTAMFNLGGVVYFLTAKNKYFMYSQTADVWTQQASSAQHGAYSQEATVCDLNYAYYANEDGIYVFDGSSERSLTKDTIQNLYDNIPSEYRQHMTLELYNNRLYAFYPTTKTDSDYINDHCLVYNTNLKVWESVDDNTTVGASAARHTASNRFICGSSHAGELLQWEDAPSLTKAYAANSTDRDRERFADQGAPIAFNLLTPYWHFGTPSQLHRITKWRPEFSMTPEPWTIKCGYALDFTDQVKYAFSIDLNNDTPLDEHYEWGAPDYGVSVPPTKLTTIPQIYGQFRRAQIRYQHIAAYEPVNFKAMTLTVQTQRIR